jgi:hypothetical protein
VIKGRKKDVRDNGTTNLFPLYFSGYFYSVVKTDLREGEEFGKLMKLTQNLSNSGLFCSTC